MSTNIISMSPPEIGDFIESFFHQLYSPEPCCLTLDDYQSINQEDFRYRRRYCSEPVVTDEPFRWASILFDPGDVVEFRLLPPRKVADEMRPKKCLQRRTTKRNSVYPWTFAYEVNVVINKLADLNRGQKTWWGRKVAGKWTDIECLSGIPLNIYAGVNPRIATGCSKNADVLLARNLFVDLDKTSLADAMQKLAGSKLPTPTMTVLSGHGVHFYWRLAEPIYDLENWKNIQKRLITSFNSDPGIHDFSRTMRVPGFMNVNGETPVLCKLHDADSNRRYSVSDILPLLPSTELPGAFTGLKTGLTPTRDEHPGTNVNIPENIEQGNNNPEYIKHENIKQGINKQGINNPENNKHENIKQGINKQAINNPENNKPEISICGDSEKLNAKQLRSRAYAKKFEPVDNNRNTTAFKRACNLAEHFNLNEAEILPLLESVNDQADDPLELGELTETIEKAVRTVHRKGKGRGTALEHQYLRVEKYVEPNEDVVELDNWRKELVESRLNSLGNIGKIYFDGSSTGAGKSTADIAAIKAAKSSAIFLPTHDSCDEEAAKLVKQGLSAAAHPPMNSETCLKFGTKANPGVAMLALLSGLNVGKCICTSCEFAKNCEYQKRRELARNADHTIATHARASLTHFESAKDKPVIFIHEDVTSLFRPVVKVVRNAKKQDTPQIKHFFDIVRIAHAAEGIAKTWQDKDAELFAKNLIKDTNELIAVLDSPDLVKKLEDAAESGNDFQDLQSVNQMKLKNKTERFEQVDYLLSRAMNSSGIRANGAALKLAIAYSLGELDQLCVVVDDQKGTGGKPIFNKGMVGVWKITPPKNCVVWIENASTTASGVEELVESKIIDKTPKGRLENKVAPVQFPDADITQGSSGNRVRSVIRGLLAKNLTAQKVGIISHKCHQAEIDKLEPFWASRISRKEYFRSGKDRASNSWLDCDLILIIGTPRVPKYAVRDLLIQTGKVAAACRNAKFGNISWEAKDENGKLVKIDGLGYNDPDWANANDNLVKETLRQGIGRGRAVTDNGVQVLVASNESLGLIIADSPLLLLSDSEDETLQLIVQLTISATERNAKYNTLAFDAVNVSVTERNAKYNPLAFDAVNFSVTERNAKYSPLAFDAVNFITTDIVAKLSHYGVRTVRLHLSHFSLLGLLMKKGARKGWIISNLFFNQVLIFIEKRKQGGNNT